MIVISCQKQAQFLPIVAHLLLCLSGHANSTPTFLVKAIVCPKICQGERLYKVVFESSGGIVSSDRGIVQNDTIVGIDPQTDYRMTVTVRGSSAEIIQQTILLPICDPIIPTAPIVANVAICEGEKIPSLNAFALGEVKVDWYSQAVGGILLATNTTTFTPSKEGTYYAQTRIASSGCVSFERTAATLSITKSICMPATVKIIKH